jgi:hypothetical protein
MVCEYQIDQYMHDTTYGLLAITMSERLESNGKHKDFIYNFVSISTTTVHCSTELPDE